MPTVATPKILSTATATGDGLWRIYSGKLVRTAIPGLCDGQPIDLVVDLATLTADGPEIPATFEHELGMGTWHDITIAPDGITQRLRLLETPDDTRGLPMFDAARQARAALAQKYPWQASLGAKPGPDGCWEIAAEPVEVNGQVHTPTDVPLVILRRGVLFETAVCYFGADDSTGRVAASRTITPLESTVTIPDMKTRAATLSAKLGAKHTAQIKALLVDGCTDDQVVDSIRTDESTAKDAQIADLTARLAAAELACKDLKTQLEALVPPTTTAGNANLSGAANQGGKGGGSIPASRLAAMQDGAVVDASGKPIRGLAAVAHLRRQFPTIPATTK